MIQSAAQYHRMTEYHRHRMDSHGLDWGNQPSPFKTYEGLDPLELPQEVRLPRPWLSSLLRGAGQAAQDQPIGLEDLSGILQLTYSLTARARRSDGEDFFFRSVASAGALYPTEIYVSATGVEGLGDGLYHFSIARHGLTPLRAGDLSAQVSRLLIPAGPAPQVTFFLSAVFFRSAWKYRDRAYRYHLLDTGHVLEHLLLALRALDLPHNCALDFDDPGVNRLLGLDSSLEAALALVCVGGRGPEAGEESRLEELPETYRLASRMARHEQSYPLILETHEAASRVVPGSAHPERKDEAPKPWEELAPPPQWPERVRFPDAVFQRRSRRNFVPVTLPREITASLVECLCAEDPHEPQGCLKVGFAVERTPGFEAGFHLLDRLARKTAILRGGNLHSALASACLNQEWLKNAAVHFLMVADLEALDRRWGPRGYRYAMLTAGRLGERIYLCATAMGLGCCGIGAFYDQEAREILGLDEKEALLYLVAAGPVKGG